MGFKKYTNIKGKRRLRVRKKLLKQEERHRLSVFRSNQYNYAQVIDDIERKTIVSASEKDLTEKEREKTKVERAYLVGKYLAQKALAQKIKRVVFDRGQYRYHGRVKAIAEGAREQGMEF